MNFLAKLFLKLLRDRNKSVLSTHRNSEIPTDLKIGDFCNFTLYPALKKIKLGKGVSIRNYNNILVGNNAELILGDRVFMNNFCSVNCLEKIEIGENTLFGEGVKLYDHNHQYGYSPDFRVDHQNFNTAPIKIGKNCWLGSNVTVLKGVTIGDNVIVGANCLIYKDIPANSIIKNKSELSIESH